MLLEKGAVTSVRSTSGLKSFYSTLFLDPYKGHMRPVINLKKLNEWWNCSILKWILRELLRVNDWMVKVDPKDAYFTIPIHIAH